jgi:hypothetical protein
MAVSVSKKNKARLDFAEAIEEAVPEIKKEEVDMAANNAVNSNESNQVDTKPVEINNVENQAKNEVVEDTQTVVDNTENTPIENNVVEEVVVDKETGEIIESDLDALLSSMSQASGKQKSVYLEYDNYAYIQEKCKKTNAKFSTVLNVLLRKAIQNQ